MKSARQSLNYRIFWVQHGFSRALPGTEKVRLQPLGNRPFTWR
jgi:hypothetical protein